MTVINGNIRLGLDWFICLLKLGLSKLRHWLSFHTFLKALLPSRSGYLPFQSVTLCIVKVIDILCWFFKHFWLPRVIPLCIKHTRNVVMLDNLLLVFFHGWVDLDGEEFQVVSWGWVIINIQLEVIVSIDVVRFIHIGITVGAASRTEAIVDLAVFASIWISTSTLFGFAGRSECAFPSLLMLLDLFKLMS